MRKLSLVVSSLLLMVGLTACTLPWQKKAALQVNSIPKATIYIDGEEKGATPFEDTKLKPGEVTVRLVPEATAFSLSPWERKVKLVAGVMSVVNWEFGENEQKSAGEVLILEKDKNENTAGLNVVSVPDSAVVRLDGEARGFTPLALDGVSAGEREIIVTANGFQDRNIKAKLADGYKLTVNVTLAKAEEEKEAEEAEETEKENSQEKEPTATPKQGITPTPKPTSSGPAPTPPDRPYIKVKDTPTGWLRVREKASTTSEEVARVNPGEMYPLLDEESGWYQIQYEEDKEGWISGQYAEKYE